MRGPLRSGRTPIGIDAGGQFLNAAQLGLDRDRWRIEAACSVVRADPNAALSIDEMARFGDVLERQGFRGTRAVLAVPVGQMVTAQLDLETADASASIDELAHAGLAAAHQGDPNRLLSACWHAGASGDRDGTTRVMAVGCDQGFANGLLDVFDGAGFDVIALDTQSLAIARACTDTLGLGLSAVLSIGWRAAQLAVVTDGAVTYERTLADAGCAALYDALQNELDLDGDVAEHILSEIGLGTDEETDETLHRLTATTRERILGWASDLVPEVRLSLTYAAHESGRDAVDSIFLVGDGAHIPGLDAELAREFGIATSTVAPSKLFASSTDCASPVLTVACGLALHGSR